MHFRKLFNLNIYEILLIILISFSIYSESATTLLSTPPTYKNRKLEQQINWEKDELVVWLDRLSLTDNDMEIVGYYLLQNNEVSNIVFIF